MNYHRNSNWLSDISIVLESDLAQENKTYYSFLMNYIRERLSDEFNNK